MKRVGLIVGHSHKEQGCYNQTFDKTEYDFNSELVPMVATELHKLGIQPTVFYRDDLSTLPTEVNQADVDVVVSFHCNAFNKIASGTETLYYHSSKKGKQLAKHINQAVVDCLGLRDRGIKPVETENGSFILRKTNAPACLIETFFLDNDVDFVVADGEKPALAKAIAEGIQSFFK